MDPSNNSFYASFKIYINKLQSVQKQQQQQNQPQVVRIEQIESSEEDEENVFLDTPQNVEVQIKVDPPQQHQHQTPKVTSSSKENSPVFYLEPEDWTEIEEATQKISPCRGATGKYTVGLNLKKSAI